MYADNRLQPIRVRLGISDGRVTALLAGDVEPGMELVTNVDAGTPADGTSRGNNPFRGGFRGRGFPF